MIETNSTLQAENHRLNSRVESLCKEVEMWKKAYHAQQTELVSARAAIGAVMSRGLKHHPQLITLIENDAVLERELSWLAEPRAQRA